MLYEDVKERLGELEVSPKLIDIIEKKENSDFFLNMEMNSLKNTPNFIKIQNIKKNSQVVLDVLNN